MRGAILLTGSSGLIGRALAAKLGRLGRVAIGLDIRGTPNLVMDVRESASSISSLDLAGIIHLAAVSRVIDGQRDPSLCRSINVGGTEAVLSGAMRNPRVPWMIYASSREVYGQQECLPVAEGAHLFPINAYAWSKFEAENLVVEKRSDGLRAAIVRFSNVYGSIYDHSTRVIPAFAAAAAWGRGIRVDGCENTFDFTHVDDVVDGLAKLISLLESGEQPPRAVHFVSGRATTLGDLASFAVDIGSPGTHIVKADARSFDVARFCGDPTLAARLLSWRTQIDLEFGFRKLVHEFRASGSDMPVGRAAGSSQEAGV